LKIRWALEAECTTGKKDYTFNHPHFVEKDLMTRFRPSVFTLLFLFLGSLVTPAHAQSSIRVISDAASLTFPESLLFQAEFRSGANITSVVLEYGVDQLTCGKVEARAFPQLTPAVDVKVDWTWEMRQSGSLPPGTTVWWRWLVSDAGGTHFTSPTKTILWLDAIHPWRVINGGNINLHYYNGGASFGQQLHDSASQALVRLSQDVGVSTESPVDIYIYANQSDMLAAVLYAPSWSGGKPYPQSNIIIIGVSPQEVDWGMNTEVHELTHVLVGHLTFSCLGFIPLWLDEGLAMYGQGGVQAAEQAQFDQAKAADQLPSLRSLSGAFSAEASRAILSYTEVYSVVDFMLKTYGRDKMTALLLDLRDGQTTDEALQTVYGLNTDGLENAWRTSIGAPSHVDNSKATPLSTPTQVPTFLPIGAAPVAAAGHSTPQPTQAEAAATPMAATTAAVQSGTQVPPIKQPGAMLTKFAIVIEFALACLVIAALLAGLVIFLIVRRQNRR
jgi:hypothetical protein